MEPVTLGPLLIPGYLAQAAIALVPAFLAATLVSSRQEAVRRRVVDMLSTALLIFVLLWKLGPIYTSPLIVFENPRLLLFGRGGAAGVTVASVGALLYLAFALLRRRSAAGRILTALLVFAVVASGVYGGVELATAYPVAGAQEAGNDGAVRQRPEAPEFSLELLEGDTLTLADTRGRPAVLNFWATWCGPCQAETPIKRRIASELAGEVHFIGVNLTRSESGVRRVREYVEESGIGYPVVLDTTGDVQQRYAVRGTPTTYLIDARGRVAHRFMGAMSYQDMMRRLNNLIQEEPPAE